MTTFCKLFRVVACVQLALKAQRQQLLWQPSFSICLLVVVAFLQCLVRPSNCKVCRYQLLYLAILVYRGVRRGTYAHPSNSSPFRFARLKDIGSCSERTCHSLARSGGKCESARTLHVAHLASSGTRNNSVFTSWSRMLSLL